MRRFIHAADIHLDSPMVGLDQYENAPRMLLRSAVRRALENLVDLAIDRDVDLVIIAGDLYDGDWTDSNTGLFFVGQAKRLVEAGIPMVVIRGNHDAANQMTNHLPLPKNPGGEEILLDFKRVDQRRFDDLGLVVHGRSYQTRAERNDMTVDYPRPIGGLFNLGVLHTGLSGLDGHAPYAPVTAQKLADKGYDYWALGHIHQRGEHHISGTAPVVYSGNIQGRHVRECGPKGCLLVEIDDRNQTKSEFCPLDLVRFDDDCRIDASSIQHDDEIMDAFERYLAGAIANAEGRMLVPRVRLVGQTPDSDRWTIRQEKIEASLRSIAVAHGGDQVWLERFRVQTSLPPRRAMTTGFDADASPSDDGLLRGPMQSIENIAQRWRDEGADALRRRMADEFASLTSKLPPEFSVDDAESVVSEETSPDQWIEQAVAELTGRLRGSEAER